MSDSEPDLECILFPLRQRDSVPAVQVLPVFNVDPESTRKEELPVPTHSLGCSFL
jgi:hypothetical protein